MSNDKRKMTISPNLVKPKNWLERSHGLAPKDRVYYDANATKNALRMIEFRVIELGDSYR